MSWADRAIARLREGHVVIVRPRGNSMAPKIKSGDRVRLRPVASDWRFTPGDVVLAKVKGRVYLHQVLSTGETHVLIGNFKRRPNGWASRQNVYGLMVRVEGSEDAE